MNFSIHIVQIGDFQVTEIIVEGFILAIVISSSNIKYGDLLPRFLLMYFSSVYGDQICLLYLVTMPVTIPDDKRGFGTHFFGFLLETFLEQRQVL